ncbi:hypothetical protein [Lentzea sp. NBRC 102530]|uniref:hypothetical protein n=1 Tax=Lentzea sp. NBRC 102530 TaxID=3032201 RepID=UPI0024A1F5DE|nr:hypothetical protein [Lentzea sp. NBRC 102530]GLY53686.1 hypothetical protein Lesp01_73420 [Lentzea sp. NBRC 102530]
MLVRDEGMRALPLRQIGALMTGAGIAMLAGMVLAVLDLPVTGVATWSVWWAVAAVAFGPLLTGVMLLRPGRRGFGFPVGFSVMGTYLAGVEVRDEYVEHPATPITTGTVAFCVIAVLSVSSTVLVPLLITPKPELDGPVGGLRRWGTGTVVLGGLLVVALVAVSSSVPVPGVGWLVGLGVATAAGTVVTGVLLLRVKDLRAAHRGRVVLLGLVLVALVGLAVVQPVAYVLMTESAVAGILYDLLYVAATLGIVLGAFRLHRVLEGVPAR